MIKTEIAEEMESINHSISTEQSTLGHREYAEQSMVVCGKQFGHFKRHMLVHSGEKQFKCRFCWKDFSKKSSLNRHLLIHTHEKPYECDVCDYKCNQKSSLKKHMITHTDERERLK